MNLEEHHKQMDANLHSLVKVTAEIKNISLTNRHDIAGLKSDVSGLAACIKALAEATQAGFKKADERHNDLVKEVRENQQENRERFDQQCELLGELLLV